MFHFGPQFPIMYSVYGSFSRNRNARETEILVPRNTQYSLGIY